MAANILLADFSRGLDTRRIPTETPPGALIVADNVVIDRGGQIRKRYKFDLRYRLPEGVFGYRSINNVLNVWGSGTRPSTLPEIIVYNRLPHPTEPDKYPMTDINAVVMFEGSPYVVATYLDNTVWHFYNNSPIFDWISQPVTTLTGLAAALARLIRDRFPAYYASASNNSIIVYGPLNTTYTLAASVLNRGSQPNTQPTVTVMQTASASRPQITRVVLSGTFEVEDRWSITIDGTEAGFVGLPIGVPTSVKAHNDKMYAFAGSVVHFSKIGDPTKWRDQITEPSNTGAGKIFVTSHDSGSSEIVGMETIGQALALFTQRSVQMWQMDPDPVLNQRLTTVQNVGSYAGQAVVGYVDGNIFFLSRQGIRTITLRDDALRVSIDDTGTLIDTLVQDLLRTASLAEIARGRATVDPREGRMILSIGTTALVFSFYPKSRVSAWTRWTIPVEAKDWIINGDELLLYGVDRSVWAYSFGEYDDTECRVVLPAHDAKNPMSTKAWESMDIAAIGRWRGYVHTDATTLNNPSLVGEFDGVTYQKQGHAISMESNALVMEFRSIGDGEHVIAAVALRHTKTRDD